MQFPYRTAMRAIEYPKWLIDEESGGVVSNSELSRRGENMLGKRGVHT